MKFLLISKPKKKAFDIPPEELMELYKAAQAFAKETDNDCLYTFPKGGGMAIVNAETMKDAKKQLKDYPMYDFFKWKVRQLDDWDATFEKLMQQKE
jgi:hypothetical protein